MDQLLSGYIRNKSESPLRTEIDVLYAHACYLRGDYQEAIDVSEAVLTRLQPTQRDLMVSALTVRMFAQNRNGMSDQDAVTSFYERHRQFNPNASAEGSDTFIRCRLNLLYTAGNNPLNLLRNDVIVTFARIDYLKQIK